MVNGHLTCILFCIATSSLLRSLSASQSVTRFSNNLRYDEFSNPDNSTCSYNGCVGGNGYKSCFDCCICICNYGSYLTSRNRCVENNQVSKDCKFVIGDDAGLDILIPMTPQIMENGQNISYCMNNWERCTTLATGCVINSSRTFYDNGKWKPLWTSESQIDFEIKRNAGGSDSLVWRSKVCNAHKFDGLLLSVGVDCYVPEVAKRINSCLVLKFHGTFVVGSNPLMRTNCTTQNLTTTTTTTELVETTPTTITVSVTSQTVLAGDPSSGATKSSKSQVILAVSLSSIALLLIIVVAVGIAAIRKRRKKSSTNGFPRREGDSIAHSSISEVPTASAAETNNGLSERTWAIDSNGGFVVIDRPPVFTVSVPESIYDEPTMEPNESLGEVFADANPSRQTTNMETGPLYSSVAKTSSFVEKGRPKIKSNRTYSNDSGEAVDDDNKIWLQGSFHLYSEPHEEEESTEAIYDEPDTSVVNESSNNDDKNSPVYMIYEPFHT